MLPLPWCFRNTFNKWFTHSTVSELTLSGNTNVLLWLTVRWSPPTIDFMWLNAALWSFTTVVPRRIQACLYGCLLSRRSRKCHPAHHWSYKYVLICECGYLRNIESYLGETVDGYLVLVWPCWLDSQPPRPSLLNLLSDRIISCPTHAWHLPSQLSVCGATYDEGALTWVLKKCENSYCQFRGSVIPSLFDTEVSTINFYDLPTDSTYGVHMLYSRLIK
jgi:hypothetical protein